MADVQFYGVGATGFPNPDVQILTGNQVASAEVQYLGVDAGPSPTGAINTVRDVFTTPSQLSRAIVDYEQGVVPVPASTSPNLNELVFMVLGGPTQGGQAVIALTIPAPYPLGDGSIYQPPPVADDFSLYRGPFSPSGIVGKNVVFLAPTGPARTPPIAGATGTIRSIGQPTGVFQLNRNPPIPTLADICVVFTNAISPQPTVGDRFVILSDDQTLRRSPVMEIILE